MSGPPPATPRPRRVSVKTAARLIGCSPQTVRNWIRAGELEAHQGKGGIKVEVAQATALGKRRGFEPADKPRGRGRPVTTGTTTTSDAAITAGEQYQASRARKEAALADKHELELEIRRGQLVSVDEIKPLWFDAVRTARSRLLGVPERVAAELAAIDEPQAVRVILEESIRDALESLADELPQ